MLVPGGNVRYNPTHEKQINIKEENNMSRNRRDSKGRVLREGESQRKDGNYMYRYYDAAGVEHFVYSWRLTEADRTPAGKKKGPSLREKEERINAELEKAKVASCPDKMTVLDLVEKYLTPKRGKNYNSDVNYDYVCGILRKEEFGGYLVKNIKPSDAKGWFAKLERDGKGYSVIHCVRGVLRPAFEMAVEDELILRNPFQFKLESVISVRSESREALNREDEKDFMEFVSNDEHYQRYYDEILILLGTGLRIGEFCGLTVHDIDMKKREIRIDHQLLRKRDGTYYITTPKTESGKRTLYMSNMVYDAFGRVLENRKAPKVEMMVDGKSGFLFLDMNGRPKVALHYQHLLKRIANKYNACHDKKIKVCPHVLRHTFCTRMEQMNMPLKSLQYVMGHADFETTMNVYAHVDAEQAVKDMRLIDGGLTEFYSSFTRNEGKVIP